MIMPSPKTNFISLGDKEISTPGPVVEGRLITKAGRMTLKGFWDNKPVKVFECANAKHAQFISKVMTSIPLKQFFPEVYGVHKRLVISEWVEGKQLKPQKFAKNKKCVEGLRIFLSHLHSTHMDESSAFDYYEDYIHPRFRKCCEVLELDSFYSEVNSLCRTINDKNRTIYLSHPDITPANIIITPGGQVKIIDNELFSASCLSWFDQLNIIYGFGRHISKNAQLWAPIFDPLKEYLDSEYEIPMLAMWLMRIVGARFVDGNIKSVLDIASTSIEEHRYRMGVWKILRDTVKN